ncbi:IucA/IucC family protein [Streptacidiphilus rugosus]|uniref:IucA/IucC family protein n=1 Tax=Streptacidiphilus rugosus TaxID=405783 RepID=UPI000568266D|nr:IucA/IucC family siderophore biosynthesis protein [Streptacidiphilus rugosus]
MRATDSTPAPPSASPPFARPAEIAFAAELHRVRPALDAAFAAELPGARAAVLARLWRALLLEPLPLDPADRAALSGPERRAHDIDAPAPGYTVSLRGVGFTDPAALLQTLRLPGSATLLAEIEHSVVSLALSRAGARAGARGGVTPAPLGGIDGVDLLGTLEDAERSVVDGHPYHPCCRSRPGFSVADQLAFAPEHGADVELELLRLPLERALLVGDWPARLREDGHVLLPVHPWQAREVLPALGLATTAAMPGAPAGTQAGALSGAAAGARAVCCPERVTAAPLMSVRTLAPVDGGPHLKTSLSLRMTSAVRDISGASVRNAMAVSGLLEAVVARLDGSLTVTRNLAACAALVDGEPSPDLAAIVRESPALGLAVGERVVPLAALAAHPVKTVDAAAWLAGFARLTWPPLLRLLDWGVALEAHGQNLLLVLDETDRPVRLVYRDLADIRVSPRRLARAGIAHPAVGGHVVDDDPVVLRRKLLGSLVGSGFGGLVSGFGGGDRREEARLWDAVAAEARRAAELLLTDGEDRRALLAEPLPVKALTLMRLDGLPGGPVGDRWTTVTNPLATSDSHSRGW